MPRIIRPAIARRAVQPVSLGGTGVRSASDARAVFGMVGREEIGLAGNVIPLDNDGVIPQEYFKDVISAQTTISGPATILPNSDNVYLITNYDYRNDYTVVASSGSVVIVKDKITYNPGSAIGVGGFSINGRLFPINVTGIGINKPIITSPVNGAVNLTESVSFSSNNFTVSGGVDIHVLSEWEVSTDKDFKNVVARISSNLVKTAYTVNSLLANTEYYVRVRYFGGTYNYSLWSEAIKFKTMSVFAHIVYPPYVASVMNVNGSTVFRVSSIKSTSANIAYYDATWEVSTEATFGSIVQSGTSTKETIGFTLVPNTYYIRVRMRGKDLSNGAIVSSDWSMVVQLTIQ